MPKMSTAWRINLVAITMFAFGLLAAVGTAVVRQYGNRDDLTEFGDPTAFVLFIGAGLLFLASFVASLCDRRPQ